MPKIEREVPLDQIIQRARLLVIDDEDFPYLKLFRRENYTITKWHDVTKLGEIEQGRFDVILLDLQGIGKEISNEQGLGVLRHIKQVRPSQIVVAYSNADWPVQYQPFFELADAVLPKSADYMRFKREVNELLYEHFNIGFHIKRIYGELDEAGANTWRARRSVRNAVASGDTSHLQRNLEQQKVDGSKAEVIIGLAQIAIGVAQIWTN